jgi:hypothetical protein
MDNLIFSQTAIFRMQQLASSYYHKTGIRHRMASPEGMLALLRETGLSTDRDIRQCYDAFVVCLNERQIDMLRERKVKLNKVSSLALNTPLRKAG